MIPIFNILHNHRHCTQPNYISLQNKIIYIYIYDNGNKKMLCPNLRLCPMKTHVKKSLIWSSFKETLICFLVNLFNIFFFWVLVFVFVVCVHWHVKWCWIIEKWMSIQMTIFKLWNQLGVLSLSIYKGTRSRYIHIAIWPIRSHKNIWH